MKPDTLKGKPIWWCGARTAFTLSHTMKDGRYQRKIIVCGANDMKMQERQIGFALTAKGAKMSDDLISRQAVITTLAIGEELLSRILDDMDVVGNDREKYEWSLGLIKSYIDDMKELPSAQLWIPVTERLPEDFVDVLVTDDSGGLATINRDCMFTKENTGERDWLASQRVTAWMPLPEPYKEDKDDE